MPVLALPWYDSTGAIAAFISTPLGMLSVVVSLPLPFFFFFIDLVMVRMQADGRLPQHLQRKYRNVFHGIYQIVKKEGANTLWKGCSPNVLRAVCVTCGQISGYDTSKLWLQDRGFKDTFTTHFVASLFAGLVTSLLACPADFLRTRYMNSKSIGVGGTVTYTSLSDAVLKIVKTEGISGFYKGWTAYYARVAPHVLSLFICFEQANLVLDRIRR